MQPLTRRRFLKITAAAGIAAALPFPLPAMERDSIYRWRGILLGAEASLQMYLPEPGKAAALVQRMLAEIRRLERIFSLHDPQSALSMLNRQGYLDAPPAELVELLNESRRYSDLTQGAFDVTVQPLWKLYSHAAPSPEAVRETLRLVDYRKISVTPERIAFDLPGMQITLNGIAQGYITDRATALLKAEGIAHTLVEMGEMRALGRHPDGRPWRIGLRNPHDPAGIIATLPLADRALATSGGYGMRFSPVMHHLFDPKTGASANHYASLSVLSGRAMVADALSTGLFVLPEAQTSRLLQTLPDIEAFALLPDGSLRQL